MMFCKITWFWKLIVSFVLTFQCSIHYCEHQALVKYRNKSIMPRLNFHQNFVNFVKTMHFLLGKWGLFFRNLLLFKRNHFLIWSIKLHFLLLLLNKKKQNFHFVLCSVLFLQTFIEANKFFFYIGAWQSLFLHKQFKIWRLFLIITFSNFFADEFLHDTVKQRLFFEYFLQNMKWRIVYRIISVKCRRTLNVAKNKRKI